MLTGTDVYLLSRELQLLLPDLLNLRRARAPPQRLLRTVGLAVVFPDTLSLCRTRPAAATSVMQNAFIPASPGAALFSLTPTRLPSATTPRRARLRYTPVARSLDSYRAGRRFEPTPNRPRTDGFASDAVRSHRDDAPATDAPSRAGDPNKPERPRRPPKQHTTLLRALLLLNVASQDTCAFLIRKRCVRVNGEVALDERLRIDRLNDDIVVSGKHVGTVNGGGDGVVDAREERLPRTRRDRVIDEEFEAGRGYNRRVDRGFYSDKKYRSGK